MHKKELPFSKEITSNSLFSLLNKDDNDNVLITTDLAVEMIASFAITQVSAIEIFTNCILFARAIGAAR